LTPGGHVIEAGPGVCALTGRLCEGAGSVTAVEIDRRLVGVIGRAMSGYGNFRLINADILDVPAESLLPEPGGRTCAPQPGAINAHSPVGPCLSTQQSAAPLPSSHFRSSSGVVFVSNLPYYISTPIMTRLFEEFIFVDRAVLMMQKEVSDKLLARPSSPNYGMLTVFAHYFGTVRKLFSVPPHSFTPQPGVESAVMLFDAHKPPIDASAGAPDERIMARDMFFRTVRASFASRRKTLANNLIHAGLAADRSMAEDAVARAGIGAGARGETLGVHEFVALSRSLTGN